jgi:anti-anti-sigma factor
LTISGRDGLVLGVKNEKRSARVRRKSALYSMKRDLTSVPQRSATNRRLPGQAGYALQTPANGKRALFMRRQAQIRGFEVEQLGPVTVGKFTISSILDDEATRRLGEELSALAEFPGSRQLVLNFTGVKRLTSTMLAKLITVHKKVKAGGGRLALCSIHPEVYAVFEMMELTKVFDIYPNEQEALESF